MFCKPCKMIDLEKYVFLIIICKHYVKFTKEAVASTLR